MKNLITDQSFVDPFNKSYCLKICRYTVKMLWFETFLQDEQTTVAAICENLQFDANLHIWQTNELVIL